MASLSWPRVSWTRINVVWLACCTSKRRREISSSYSSSWSSFGLPHTPPQICPSFMSSKHCQDLRKHHIKSRIRYGETVSNLNAVIPQTLYCGLYLDSGFNMEYRGKATCCNFLFKLKKQCFKDFKRVWFV